MARSTIECHNTDTIGLFLNFQPVARVRLQQVSMEFVAPSRGQAGAANSFSRIFASDAELEERRALYTITSEVDLLPDTDHFTVGSNHAWDIARRFRGVQC